MLGPAESKIARALLGGHAASIAKAVLGQDDLREAIIILILVQINEECTNLCKKDTASLFHTIPFDPGGVVSLARLTFFFYKYVVYLNEKNATVQENHSMFEPVRSASEKRKK